MSRKTIQYCTRLLSEHLQKIRSPWRRLPPARIVVIVLAVLRHDQRIADMADANEVGETTVRRWRGELISLLAARAPPPGPHPQEDRQAARRGCPD